MLDLILVRALFVLLFAASAVFLAPETWRAGTSALVGAFLGGAAILASARLQKLHAGRLIGMCAGLLGGLVGAALVSVVIGRWVAPGIQFAELACLLLFGFLGASIGAGKGEFLNLRRLGAPGSGGDAAGKPSYKILDTSVVIDGRIADIADTGFLDGTLIIPQFVLHELQMVADSADSMKRNRGRRGLDVLQRIQKMAHLQVQIVEQDFPNVREVDMKLIELAKVYDCKIVTNDFNLNKVAQLRGVEVLNINELANSLKPIVLPGEQMRVFILKEGKEYNQGVAYLDDGTMVVVDNARRMISKTIDVSVTSVLQTTAGKMIFGKFDERSHSQMAGPSVGTQAAAGPVATPLPATAPGPAAGPISERPPRRETAVGEN